MSHFWANEMFSVEPFIMLGIDSGWSEKLVRFFSARLPNWGKSKMENRNSKLEIRKSGAETRGAGLGDGRVSRNQANRSQWT